jgi:hypothetical protein
LLSARRVREANAGPAAKRIRYAYSEIEGTLTRPFIRLAGMTLRNCRVPVQIAGFPVLMVDDAEEVGGPYRLSATFFDDSGQVSLLIRQNEWSVLTGSWDVEVVGPSVTVRTAPGEIALRLSFVAGEGLVVTRLEMLCAGYRLSGSADTLEVFPLIGGRYSFTRCLADGTDVGLSLG